MNYNDKIDSSLSIDNEMKELIKRRKEGEIYCKFKICDSILKTHFKNLMKISKMYNSKEKTGFILESNKDEYTSLLNKIERSNSDKCRESHKKSIERKIERNNLIYCDHRDLGSFGYMHGETVSCPFCGMKAEVW